MTAELLACPSHVIHLWVGIVLWATSLSLQLCCQVQSLIPAFPSLNSLLAPSCSPAHSASSLSTALLYQLLSGSLPKMETSREDFISFHSYCAGPASHPAWPMALPLSLPSRITPRRDLSKLHNRVRVPAAENFKPEVQLIFSDFIRYIWVTIKPLGLFFSVLTIPPPVHGLLLDKLLHLH